MKADSDKEKSKRRNSAPDLLGSGDIYKDIIQNMPDAVIILDRKGNLLEASEMAQKLSGYKRSEAVGKNLLTMNLMDVQTRAMVAKKISFHFSGKELEPFEINIKTKSGPIIPVEIRAKIIKLNGKDVCITILRDLTENKEAEKKFRNVIQKSIDGFCITDIDGNLLDANDSYCKSIGYSREELLKKKITDIEVLEKPKDVSERIRKIIKTGGDRFETRQKRKDGKLIDFEVSVNYIDEDGGRLFVFLREITERKLITDEVEKSEKLYRTLTESISDKLYFFDENRCVKFVNSAAAKKHSVNQNDMVCRSIESLFAPDTAKFLQEKINESLKNCQPIISEYHEIYGNSDTWSEIRISPVIKESGKPDSVVIISHDITKRKKAEESLGESERKFRNLVENSLVGIYKTNVSGQFLFANRALIDMFGFANLEEIQKAGIIKLYVNLEDRKGLIEILKKNHSIPNFETIYTKKDGTQMNVLLSATLDGDEISGMMMDITERKTVEGRMKKINDDLNAKLNELERFNKVAIGRELKMVELKKKIAELERGRKNDI